MSHLTTLFKDKTDQAFADTLEVFGLAHLIDDLLFRQGGGKVTIADKGAYYQLSIEPGIDLSRLDELCDTPIHPIPFIRTPKNGAQLPAGAPYEDYEAQKQAVNEYYEARKKGATGEQLPPKPMYWDIFRAINPAALPGYNGLLESWWQVRAAQPEIIKLLFEMYGQTPNDLEVAVESWKRLDKANGWGIKPGATGQQLYNPNQGKGHNKSKSDGLSIGNLDSFWLVEWLKAVGFYEAAVTRLMSGSKDRKTYVIAPRELSTSDNLAILRLFADTLTSETSIRFDILASIRYTQALLNHFTSEPSLVEQLIRKKRIKQQLVAGFYTAFYKDLGNAVATMNMAFIGLPGWVVVETRDDADIYQELLSELMSVTRQFDESHSDAFTLLGHLRDFVSGDNLDAFFRFTNAFPAYYMGMVQKGKWAYRFSMSFIERLIMNTNDDLTPIIQNEGFRRIAYAIRQSTVTAQYLTQLEKRQGRKFPYDVRYGLNQELTRKAAYAKDFAEALSDFLISYNAENAQVAELMSKKGVEFPFRYQRKNVSEGDIDEVIQLIKEFGSKTVAKMLVAYGYASRGSESDIQEEQE
jgi:hypothetical protein